MGSPSSKIDIKSKIIYVLCGRVDPGTPLWCYFLFLHHVAEDRRSTNRKGSDRTNWKGSDRTVENRKDQERLQQHKQERKSEEGKTKRRKSVEVPETAQNKGQKRKKKSAEDEEKKRKKVSEEKLKQVASILESTDLAKEFEERSEVPDTSDVVHEALEVLNDTVVKPAVEKPA